MQIYQTNNTFFGKHVWWLLQIRLRFSSFITFFFLILIHYYIYELEIVFFKVSRMIFYCIILKQPLKLFSGKRLFRKIRQKAGWIPVKRSWTQCTLLWIIDPEFRSGFKPYLRIYQNLTNLSFIHFSGFLSMTLLIMQYCSDFRQKLQTRLFVYMKSSAWTDTRSIYRSKDKSYFTFV